MGRTIDFCGEPLALTDFEAKHRYANQTEWVDNIPINPVLRLDFDMTPNDERDDLEILDWWGKPFIRTNEWVADTWADYCERTATLSNRQTEAEFLAQQEKSRLQWYAAWPTGIRYDVRVLDGGAWDRSTGKAMVGSLAEALAIAKRCAGAAP